MDCLKILVQLKKRTDTDITPPWSQKIERWYQLDELSFSFCEALHEWNYLENFKRPEIIFLAAEGASNLADLDFVNAGSQSPSKFVYTLPNIAASVVFQMLNMNGKVFCISEGEKTIAMAEVEAKQFVSMGKCVWLFGSRSKNDLTREVIFQTWS